MVCLCSCNINLFFFFHAQLVHNWWFVFVVFTLIFFSHSHLVHSCWFVFVPCEVALTLHFVVLCTVDPQQVYMGSRPPLYNTLDYAGHGHFMQSQPEFFNASQGDSSGPAFMACRPGVGLSLMPHNTDQTDRQGGRSMSSFNAFGRGQFRFSWVICIVPQVMCREKKKIATPTTNLQLCTSWDWKINKKCCNTNNKPAAVHKLRSKTKIKMLQHHERTSSCAQVEIQTTKNNVATPTTNQQLCTSWEWKKKN